jgi:hypothetical protein
MDYTPQIQSLVVGDEYILSPDVDTQRVAGGFHRHTQSLKSRFHVLSDKMPLAAKGKYILSFERVLPEEASYVDAPDFDTRFINQPGINPLFLTRREFAERQDLSSRKIQDVALQHLYAPGGHFYKKARASWNNKSQTAGKRSNFKRRTLKRRSLKKNKSRYLR